MSAMYRGYFDAHRGPNGLLIIDHATDSTTAGFWRNADPQVLNAIPNPEVQVETDSLVPIPKQRAGNAYDTAVLNLDGGEQR